MVAKLSSRRSVSKVSGSRDQVSLVNDQQRAASRGGGGGEVVAEAAKSGRHGRGLRERSAQLLGQECQKLGRGHRGKGEVNRGHAEFLGETAGDQGLARPGRTEEQGGAMAMLQAVTQPAQGGVAAGQRDVRRRADRLAEGPVLQAVMIFVHALSTYTNVSARPSSGTPPASRTSRARSRDRSPVMLRL